MVYFPNTVLVIVQARAVTQSELHQRGSRRAGEAGFNRIDSRGRCVEDSVVGVIPHGFLNDLSMNVFDGWFESAVRNDSVNQVGIDQVPDFRAQSLLHLSGPWREIDEVVGRMAGLTGSSQILG